MTAPRFALPFAQPVNANGVPLAGAKLYFYASGTSTPLDTYSDSGRTTPHTNPVIADSAGRFPSIFLGSASYKVVLKNKDGALIRTDDPVFISNDLSDYVYTLSRTGAVQRSAGDKFDEVLSVKDFGACGDGETDDTAAIQKAIDCGGAIRFPGGTYLISDTLTSSNKPLVIIGEGRDASVIVQTCASKGVISFSSTGSGSNPNNVDGTHGMPLKSLTMRDIRLSAGVANAGTAVSASWADGTTNEPLFVAENLSIGNVTSTSYGFNIGIDLNECNGTRIDGLWISGDQASAASSTTTANPFTMTAGIRWRGTGTSSGISHMLSGIAINNCGYAIEVQNKHEGFYISNAEFVTIAQGIRYLAGSGLNFFMQNAHVDFRESGALFLGVANVVLTACDFRHQGGLTSGVTGNFVQITDGEQHKLTACSFTGYSATGTGSGYSENAIYLDGTAFRVVVGGCNFQGVTGAGVYAAGNSNNISVRGNTFAYCNDGINISSSSITSFTEDGNTFSNIIGNKVFAISASVLGSKRRCATITNPNTQTIGGGGTLAKVSLPYIDNDDGIGDTSNSRVVVPNGVKRVRLTGGVAFAGTSATHRHSVKIVKNGATSTYQTLPQMVGDGDGLAFSLASGAVAANPGDYFEMYASWDGSGSVTLYQYYTYLSLEVVD